MGVRESQRSAKGRPHTLNGQAGGYQVIGPGHHPQRSRNGPRKMGTAAIAGKPSYNSWQAQPKWLASTTGMVGR